MFKAGGGGRAEKKSESSEKPYATKIGRLRWRRFSSCDAVTKLINECVYCQLGFGDDG